MDNKISNANASLSDDNVKESETIGWVIQSFKRIAENEVFTPHYITELRINSMASLDFNEYLKKFIDRASKFGI